MLVTNHFKTDTPTEHFWSHKTNVFYMHVIIIIHIRGVILKKNAYTNGLSGYNYGCETFFCMVHTYMCSKKTCYY